MTALDGHMKNIPPTLFFYYSSNPFSQYVLPTPSQIV